MPMQKQASGIALIAVAATLWGTWPLYTRAGGPSGLGIGFLALVVMALPAPFVLRRAAFADRGAVRALLLLGVADAANMVLYFSALERGPVVAAVLSHYLAPTLVALAAPLFLSGPANPRARWASPVVLVGLGLVLDQGSAVEGWGLTTLLGAGSAVFYATVVLATPRAARSFGPMAVLSGHAALSAALMLALFGPAVLPARLDRGLAIVLFGCTVNGLLGALLFNLSLRRLEAPLVSLFTYLEPLTAALLGVALLGDPMGPRGALGIGLVVVAGGWAALAPQRSAERPSALPSDSGANARATEGSGLRNS